MPVTAEAARAALAARRAVVKADLASAYLRYLCAPGADLEFEYYAYADTLLDLARSGRPEGVLESYLEAESC